MDPVEALLLESFREQRAALWGFFLRGGGEGGVAEDLLQETFLRAWDHRGSLAGGVREGDRDGMRRVLWRIARNLMIDEIRRRTRHRAHEGPLPQADAAASPGPDEDVEMEDCLRVVRESVERLPDAQARRCLRLWMQGVDPAAIPREVGLPPGRVRGLLQRARAEVVRRAADRLRVRRETG